MQRPAAPQPAPALQPAPPPVPGRWSTPFVLLVAALSLGVGVGLGLFVSPRTRPLPPVPSVPTTPSMPAEGLTEAPPDAGAGAPDEGDAESSAAPEVEAAVEAAPDGGRVEGALATAATPAPTAAPKPRVFVVPYEPYEGSARRIIIPVTFGRVKARLLLDTGAPGTMIFPKLAARLGALETNEGRLMTIAGGLGGQRAAVLVVLDSLCVDEACTEFVPATVVDQVSDAFEGLVGMDFLAGYQVDLDTSRHVLTLTEHHRPDSPGGHDERWWRDTFSWFAREKANWSRVHTSLSSRLERLEAPPGMSLDEARQFVDFSASQTRQIELLSNRLERHASFNAVPREWRH